VSQRTKEIGVRVALGAQSADVVRMIVGQGVGAALIGTAIGMVGAYALGRAIASLLYQVPATDPLVFGSVVIVLLVVALVAAYVPARRASRIAPMIALRSE
jgi:putative ABC transport system permease protein